MYQNGCASKALLLSRSTSASQSTHRTCRHCPCLMRKWKDFPAVFLPCALHLPAHALMGRICSWCWQRLNYEYKGQHFFQQTINFGSRTHVICAQISKRHEMNKGRQNFRCFHNSRICNEPEEPLCERTISIHSRIHSEHETGRFKLPYWRASRALKFIEKTALCQRIFNWKFASTNKTMIFAIDIGCGNEIKERR